VYCIKVRCPGCNLFSLVSGPYDPCSVEDGLEDVIYGQVAHLPLSIVFLRFSRTSAHVCSILEKWALL
jgi:hypothetical protein